MQGDIRKWFMKQHDKDKEKEKDNGNAPKPAKPALAIPGKTSTAKDTSSSSPVKSVQGGQESSGRRKTSKYFASEKQNQEDAKEASGPTSKRKVEKSSSNAQPSPAKKLHKVNDDDDDDDFVLPKTGKSSDETTPSKKLKSGSGKGIPSPSMKEESDEDTPVISKSSGRGRGRRGGATGGRGKKLEDDEGGDGDDEDAKEVKSGGRGRGGRGGSAAAGGRGGGRGGFMPFGERKDPPHKGEKEVPEGSPECLSGLTFVISGTLDSLEREEAEDLIKRHGGRVTGSVSKKTTYLLCDEDIGGRKSETAKKLGTKFLTEDGLFDMIRASNRSKVTKKEETKKPVTVKEETKKPVTVKEETEKQVDKITASVPKASPQKAVKKKDEVRKPTDSLPWTEKYKPKVLTDIIGNQSLVKQLHDWLKNWDANFLSGASKGKGKKPNDSGAKKAILLSGTPGIGKTTSAKLVSKMLGFQTIEVNASDSRGKADSKIEKGIGSSTANSIKELVSNQSLNADMNSSKHPKAVLIMDEVDGMSAGDRGGVADLILSIKTSKIPIICICNDRYSQKLKSLVNYCLLLSFHKPTKQQMAKRLAQVAKTEGLQVNEVALEELASRVNGDMRMALNQLQYMSLSMREIKYDDIRQRLLNSSKDEDMSPFTAVQKLFDYNGGNLRMDERFDLSTSDPDLVPLIIQENYINYRPSSVKKDENGVQRMNLIARAADSIANADIINVQIRRYQKWQLFPSSTLQSSIIPAALLHGSRETLEQGERNFNRFGGWLGKNSTMGKNYRLLDDVHVHLLSSLQFNLGRRTLCLEYLSLLLKHMTDPLKTLTKDEAVEKVVEFMDEYSISQEDFESLMAMSKFQGRPNLLDGVPPAVKAALTKAYNKGSKSRVIRSADLITLPGIKKAPKKRVAAMLEPIDDGVVADADVAQNDENNSDAEDLGDGDEEKPKVDIESLSSKGIQLQMESKATGTKRAPAGRGRGGGGRGAGASSSKRKSLGWVMISCATSVKFWRLKVDMISCA
ncbi:putative BRCT domain, AAA+ ATPase domain, ATPase, AAA-type, core, replication factor C subunit 1 [Helianthus annuus]|nr:putative BRCT domain, AAA+ ATPase domain, ATPase, AAA-type, core, replication factor C subunit 1 [Helianthus annuus]